MSYRDYSLQKIKEIFSIDFEQKKLFSDINGVKPSLFLIETLERNKRRQLSTEKSKSEFIIAPILAEIEEKYSEYIYLFSGEILNVDKKLGLMGECDFIFTKNNKVPRITSPIISVIEAKKSDIDKGIDQCSAQLVGLKFFNEKQGNIKIPLYGCVTNSDEWRFLKLENNIITIDIDKYFIKEIDIILGIFDEIIIKREI